MRIKGLATLGLVVVMSLSSVFSSFAGSWKRENNTWRYLEDDGTYLTNTWKNNNDAWVYLDENGFALKEQWFDYNGKHYYLDSSGVMLSNQHIMKEEKGRWVTLFEVSILGTSYYKITDFYYLGADGAMYQNQWLRNEDGEWTYFGEDGAMLRNTTTPDGYVVNGAGYWTVDGVVQIQ